MSVHFIIGRLNTINSELLNKASAVNRYGGKTPSREIAQAEWNLRDAARLVRAAELALQLDEANIQGRKHR